MTTRLLAVVAYHAAAVAIVATAQVRHVATPVAPWLAAVRKVRQTLVARARVLVTPNAIGVARHGLP